MFDSVQDQVDSKLLIADQLKLWPVADLRGCDFEQLGRGRDSRVHEDIP
jgi:hypothetical protein